MRQAVAYAVAAAATISVVVAVARHVDALRPGLAAQYTQAAVQGPPVSRIDSPPFSAALEAAPFAPSTQFNVTWTGQVWAPAAGEYTLAINADAGTSLFVDGQTVFDNVRFRDVQFASATVSLARGAHSIFISYANGGGHPRLDLSWARDGTPLLSVPASALQPRREGAVMAWLGAAIAASPFVLGWVWAVLIAAVGLTAIGALLGAGRRALASAGVWHELRWILLGSFILTTTGIWWGLPAAWVPIELTPTFVLDALSVHFSHGWYDAYPPLHYYILSLAISPLLVLRALTGADIYGVAGHTVLVLIFRLVTVAAASGMVACACLCGAHLAGRRAGLAGAAAFAMTAPFVFYSKTANVDVPYLFWFAISMVLYLRLVRELRLRDFVLFAAAATCAVCTKDQAYGFYVLVPFAVVLRLWQDARDRGAPRPLLRACIDPRLLAAAATAAVLFALIHNLLFNMRGFRGHIAFITGPGSDTYQIYEATLAGRRALLGLTLHLIQVSMGWPLVLLGAAGLGVVMGAPRMRRDAVFLLTPVVSYYVFFLDVILYNYDRFVLPMCFVAAVLAGVAIDRLLHARRARPLALGAVGAVFAYTLLYAGTVDALMLNDSRYDAERWMKAHIGGELVGVTELPELLPAVDDFRTIAVGTVEELQRERPRFIVLNADYARAAAPGTPWAELVDGIERERLGYRAVARFRNPPPWPWLPGAHPDLVGPRRDDRLVFSVLRDINPTIDVFEREPVSGSLRIEGR